MLLSKGYVAPSPRVKNKKGDNSAEKVVWIVLIFGIILAIARHL